MSSGRISVVYQLAQQHCMARIDCGRCSHSVLISPVMAEKMFGRLERLDNAAKRLKCSRCHYKGARIEVVRPRGR